METWNVAWIIGGDFNAVRCSEERNGGEGNLEAMIDFNDFIANGHFVDIPMLGEKFTWSNNRANPSMSRFDRFLMSGSILEAFPNLFQKSLPRSLYDHNPVHLVLESSNWGPKPFRFFNFWLERPDFNRMVKDFWQSVNSQAHNSAGLWLNLRKLKPIIKRWQKESCNIDPWNIQTLENEIDALEKLEQEDSLPADQKEVLLSKRAHLWSLYRAEERSWHQKSRVQWLKLGDRNTRYFHLQASARRRTNYVGSLTVNGVTISKPHDLKEAVASHFEQHFTKSTALKLSNFDCSFKSLSVSQSSELESPFTEAEVSAAIDSCDGNKAPGPDGFNLSFYKHSWSSIKNDVMNFMADFYSSGSFDRGINSSFIALIPKTSNPSSLTDYRPISLVGSLYKILAKVMANRLKKTLSSVIGDYQFAFVSGKQILDCSFIANEIIDDFTLRKESGALVKNDFEKAFDSVDWVSWTWLCRK